VVCVCVYIYIYIYIYSLWCVYIGWGVCVCVCVCMYVCVCIYIYCDECVYIDCGVCLCVYIYIYIYIHTHSLTSAYLLIVGVSYGYTRLHSMRHALGRTPLDERWAHRRDLYLYNTQHSKETDVHAAGGIRTHNPIKRAAADPRFR
jgi:hypothetical protein